MNDNNIRSFFIILFLVFSQAFPQEDLSIDYANSITVKDIRAHLSILASDAMEGRETGEAGQKMAAAYIEYHFKKNGLEPIVNTPSGNSFLQTFDLVKIIPHNTWIKIGDNSYKNFKDFFYTGNDTYKDPLKSKLVFVGEGNDEDYKAIPTQGKNVLIYSDGNRKVRREKTDLAIMHGAINVFIISSSTEDDFNKTLKMYQRYTSSGKLTLPSVSAEVENGYFFISQSMGLELLNTNLKSLQNAVDKSKEGKYAALIRLKSQEITFYASQEIQKVSTENVLGFIEGTDKKNEYIIVSAHYDHIGTDGEEVNNGADDDGSGTVAVMEMAQAFALAKDAGHGPRRSMLFLTVKGEEKSS